MGLGKACALKDDAVIQLVGDQIDRVTRTAAAFFQQVCQRPQGLARIDAAGRVVRRVDDDGSGAGRERGGNSLQVQVKVVSLTRTRTGTPPTRITIAS